MNNNILKKCLEELTREGPNIDYVRGMLETLVELNSPPTLGKVTSPVIAGTVVNIQDAAPPFTNGSGITDEAMPPTPRSLVKGIAHEAISRG